MTFVDLTELQSKYNICLGITPWKRSNFTAYVGGAKNRRFESLAGFKDSIDRAAEEGARIVCWASSAPENISEIAQLQGVEVIFVEDGFIRSSGLGIKLNMPASLCFSRVGIHYDSSKPTDLEIYLNTHAFTDKERLIGKNLIEILKSKQISKYNIKGKEPEWPANPGQKRILVIGQVEDDASIAKGSPQFKRNADLLARCRSDNTNASIMYRPHPDVTAGLRAGKIKTTDVLERASYVSKTGDILKLVELSDEVHVISSQTGLEALQAGKEVVCYGQPFYSGWGLTKDMVPTGRRPSKRTLEELIYAAFVAYPTYVDPFFDEPSNVFATINLISEAKKWPRAPRSFLIAVWLKRKTLKAKSWARRLGAA